MGELKHVIVQILDEDEREVAEKVLKEHGDVSMSQCYVRGYGSDEDIEKLLKEGLLVEHFGAGDFGADEVDHAHPTAEITKSKKLSLRWLEPEEETDEEAASLSDEFEPLGGLSAIMELASGSSEICIIQLKGPMRNSWKEQLDSLGVKIISYKPEFAYSAMLEPGTRGDVESLDFVARIVDLQPTKRLRQVREKTIQAKVVYEQQRAKIEVKVGELGEKLHDAAKHIRLKIGDDDLESLGADSSVEEAAASQALATSQSDEGEGVGLKDKLSDAVRSTVQSAVDALGGLFKSDEAPSPSVASDEPEAASPDSAAAAVAAAAGGDVEPAAVETVGDASSAAVAPPAAEPTLIKYELTCHLPEQIPVLAEGLKKDSRVADVESGRFRIRFSCEEDSAVIKELAMMTQMVSRIDPYIEPEIANDYARIGIGLELEDKTTVLPWNGSGVTVGVADTGVDKEHPDLKNKLVEIIPRAGDIATTDELGHGTHVCGIIAGDGTASGGKLRGVASGAKLVVQGIVNEGQKFSGLPIDMGELFQEAYDRGVRIHNNSWGIEVKGLYSIDSFEVDEFVYSHPDFLVIFSAGNDGVQVDNDNPDPDDAGRIRPMSLRSPATSKNALTVGACCSIRKEGGPYVTKKWRDYRGRKPAPKFPAVAEELICGDYNVLAAFSSRGPSDDERIKPDLVAPGTVIASTRSSNAEARDIYEQFDGQYVYMSGTSQAAPVVAGAAAIVREYYTTVREHDNPSAALMKATLINGAQWIETPSAEWPVVGKPNPHQGFGRLDLSKCLPVPDNPDGFRLLFVDINRTDPGALNKGTTGKGIWARRVRVEKGIPLRITLAWTDKPGKGLQQDLDLMLKLPEGMTMPDGKKKAVGNHFLARHPAFQTDHRNNVEQILIADPEPGFYTINVLAYNTPFEDQGFSLVVTGKLTSDFLP
jgi:serine protease AprX